VGVGFHRVAASLASALMFAFASSALADPDRSGEPLLRTLFAKPATGIHVRINREVKGSEDPSFTSDHVSELWVTPDGKFRFEQTDLWGGARLVVNDGSRLVEDDLDGGSPSIRPGWQGLKTAADLHGLLGGSFSAVHLLLIGSAAFDDLVDKDSDIREQPIGAGRRKVTFQCGRLGQVSVTVAPQRDGWSVVQVDVAHEATRTRDLVWFLPQPSDDRFDTSFAKGPPTS
jgi:hypothetical protein